MILMIKQNNYSKKFTIIFFIFFFFTGLFITKDYGVSSDEYASRIKGFVTLNYIGEKIAPKITQKFKAEKQIPQLHEYAQKIYGVVFEASTVLFEVLADIKDKKNQFLSRHYFNFIIFFIATIFFYRILKLRFNNETYALLGTIFLILSPRIFADSFYNNKDLVFLSFFTISSYYSMKLIKKQNFKNSVKFSLFAALTIDIRVLGILFVHIFYNSDK